MQVRFGCQKDLLLLLIIIIIIIILSRGPKTLTYKIIIKVDFFGHFEKVHFHDFVKEKFSVIKPYRI